MKLVCARQNAHQCVAWNPDDVSRAHDLDTASRRILRAPKIAMLSAIHEHGVFERVYRIYDCRRVAPSPTLLERMPALVRRERTAAAASSLTSWRSTQALARCAAGPWRKYGRSCELVGRAEVVMRPCCCAPRCCGSRVARARVAEAARQGGAGAVGGTYGGVMGLRWRRPRRASRPFQGCPQPSPRGGCGAFDRALAPQGG